MKRLLVIVLAVLMILPVFASSGDTINIGGVVPLILTLGVDTSAYSSDNLTLVGSTASFNPDIADISITTNNSAGWELWITSVNADATTCSLTNDDADAIAYTLTYTSDNAATAVSGTAVAATTGTMYAEATAANTAERYSETGTLSITYNQSTSNPAGYYSDQLTIVLRAK